MDVGHEEKLGSLKPYDTDDNIPQTYNETGGLGSVLEARGSKDFRFFRRHFYTRSCGPNAENCVDATLDQIATHTSCNGGGCGGELFEETDLDAHFCDKDFNVCGKRYQMKYTGEEPSCMRLKWFSQTVQKGLYHGAIYAKLMEGDKRVGTCKVDSKRSYAKSCSIWGATDYWSQVQCFFD